MARAKKQLPVSVETVLQRYEKGEELREISASLGMAERTMYRRLLEHKDKWIAAQEGQALQRYQAAKANHGKSIGELEALKRQLDEEGIVDSSERKWRLAHVVAVTQAYEKAMNRAEWELERLVSRIYGAKQEVRLEVNVNLADRLVKARERVIEPDAVHQIPNSEP
jgi:hypothetical protein